MSVRRCAADGADFKGLISYLLVEAQCEMRGLRGDEMVYIKRQQDSYAQNSAVQPGSRSS